ncbi:copper chaperone PCu(A)C [Yinghuangia seranimata]|uniref:copper chaperone PCu(A)C n=1 Tax=Yinghuangia seranimata TaxID=408067 RepID=UPI00248B6416|nr:copper chaperone PCu(A)C [Yinghuangia seranimata]MDI2131903.1 copper chaperone PCu(A)C [Yinghuangia seranimata]
MITAPLRSRIALRRRTTALVAGGVLALAGGIPLVACGSSSSPKWETPSVPAGPVSANPNAARSSDASTGAPKLRVVDPYIPQPAKQGTAAGYLVVQNDGDAADRLLSVSTPLTASAGLHQTSGNSMSKVDAVDVPAHGKGVLARGGTHIMFEDVTKTLKKGDTVTLTLTFEKSGPITVQVPVLGAAERPGDASASPTTSASGSPSGSPSTGSSANGDMTGMDHTSHGG